MVKPHIPMHIAWVVLLFFLSSEAFAQTPAPNTSSRSDNNLHQTHDNRPQWQDVGLKDILMVEGQSTVTAPNPVRPLHDGAGQGGSHGLVDPILHHRSALYAVSPKGTTRVSLYLWHFLRL